MPPLPEALSKRPSKPASPSIRLFTIFTQLQLSVTISWTDVCLSQPPSLAPRRCSEPTAEGMNDPLSTGEAQSEILLKGPTVQPGKLRPRETEMPRDDTVARARYMSPSGGGVPQADTPQPPPPRWRKGKLEDSTLEDLIDSAGGASVKAQEGETPGEAVWWRGIGGPQESVCGAAGPGPASSRPPPPCL